jgi:hypothetical protein
MNQWQIGKIKVTRIVEMKVTGGTSFILPYATREALLEDYADQSTLVIGTHFSTPTAGHVKRRKEGGYWLDVGSSSSD